MPPSTRSSRKRSPERPAVTVTDSWRFEAIGTAWEIETPEPLSAEIRDAVGVDIEAYDRAWSRFRADSLVSRIGREAGTWTLPAEAGALLELYRVLYDATDGRMSPLVARSLERLGYGPGLALRPSGAPIPAPAWNDAIAWDGAQLQAPRPVTLDVGAAGKGQLVDLVHDRLASFGVVAALVDASGDLRRSGPGTIRIGLEHPGDPTRVVGVVELGTGALCASAINRRAWGEGLHHVLEATTGMSIDRVSATWVVADTAMVADGVATALFLTEPERIPSALGFEFARIIGGRIECSSGFPGEVFA